MKLTTTTSKSKTSGDSESIVTASNFHYMAKNNLNEGSC